MRKILLCVALALLLASPAFAAEGEDTASAGAAAAPKAAAKAPEPAKTDVFTLGEISVLGQRESDPIATTTLDKEDMWDFSQDTLLDALNVIPGVFVEEGTGTRNEPTISVRGQDVTQAGGRGGAWRVPVMMDGIRVFLPADGGMDSDRFMMPDLAEIQVSKGYVSVLNGPDGLAGAINLVTKKPLRKLEGELRLSANFDRNLEYNGYVGYARVATRQDKFYVQVAGTSRDSNGWTLSRDFKPAANENGGHRDYSDKKDWRGSFKVGFTPNDTDEYSLNYVHQEGEKHGLHPVTGGMGQAWDWPAWDTSSLYWLSHTQLGAKSYVKTRAFYNTFENTLTAFTNTTRRVKNWTSYYDDNAVGASIEAGTDLLPLQTLKGSFHYRRDYHSERDYTHATNSYEPWQKNIVNVYSVALEDTVHIIPKLDLVLGISRDRMKVEKAQEMFSGVLGDFPDTPNHYATNYQGALIYRYRDTGKAYISAQDRTRFPTNFERFSATLGGNVQSNVNLEPERGRNFEVGIGDRIFPWLYGEVSLFHSRVKDAIESVYLYSNAAGTTHYTQRQNVGDATFKGVETSFVLNLVDTLDIGGNFSYIHSEVNNRYGTRTGWITAGGGGPGVTLSPLKVRSTTPKYKAFLYAKWQALPGLKITPSVSFNGKRWSQDDLTGDYARSDDYVLAHIKAEYKINPKWIGGQDVDVSLAMRNIFDKNWFARTGYPQEGRNFIFSLRYQF